MENLMSTLKTSLVSSLHKCDARAATAATPRSTFEAQRQRGSYNSHLSNFEGLQEKINAS